MKNKFLKTLSLILFFGATIHSAHVSAGGGSSKPVSFTAEQKAIITDPQYYPHHSPDGGKAYFSAWNSPNDGQIFNIFTQKYAKKIQNEQRASELEDSVKDDSWYTHPAYFGPFKKIEDREAHYAGKYILRVDDKNKIIYTIRKSKNEYLCTFYTLNLNMGNLRDTRVDLVYYLLLPSESNVNQSLLPIDKDLLKN